MGKQNSTKTQFFIMLRLIKANQVNFLSKLDSILEKRKSKNPNINSKIKFIIKDIKKIKTTLLLSMKKNFQNIKIFH